MGGIQPVRGTRDILPHESRQLRNVGDRARAVAEQFGYEEVETPILEFSEVFKRTLGDTSDIVTKEMYTFADNGGDELTLRPEGTAGIARMLISSGLAQDLPLKFFYRGPMFRYERPQKGRYRQFHQVGVELLGVQDPIGDVEIIALGSAILGALGLLRDTTLELNTLGNAESREVYRENLVAYLSDHRDGLSENSQMRLTRNPLRILDSKDKKDQEIVSGAPHFADSLDAESEEFFDQVQRGLDSLNITYSLNSRLVRGLDYYCHTAFEFTTQSLGAQGTVLAGGRYDGLVAQMGGTKTPGVGWAAGIERLALLAAGEIPGKRPIAVIPATPNMENDALVLAHSLRKDGYTIELAYRGNLSRRMKRANKLKASAVVILGPDEAAKGAVTLRDLDSGVQSLVPLHALTENLTPYR